MLIINPSVEYLPQIDPIDHVAKCGHICYCTPEKDHEANVKFYANLVNSKHLSVLRHESHYYLIPAEEVTDLMLVQACNPYVGTQWTSIRDDYNRIKEKHLCISANGQFLLEHWLLKESLNKYEVTLAVFKKKAPELCRYTFCLTTQISTSRELARHSPQNFTEMSTRYIKFGGRVEPSIVRPHWMDNIFVESYNINKDGMDFNSWPEHFTYVESCEKSFEAYQKLLEIGKMKAQEARGVLPLDTMTKVIMTHSVQEWRKIINMRLYDTTGAAHGNCHVIMGLVEDELKKLNSAMIMKTIRL